MLSKTEIRFKETEIGMIPEDWEVSRLKDISIRITDGSHFSPKACPNGNRIIATVKDMRYNGFSFGNCKRISNNDFKSLVRNGCSPNKGDILISKDGANCLDIIFVYNGSEEIVLLSSIAILTLKKGFNPVFYRYYLLSPLAQKLMREGYVSGSAIPRVILKDFGNIPVPILPRLDLQEVIAETLSSLDEKIKLNHQMNKTLEKISQTIFKHWFVDFEFPNEKGKPYKSSGGEMVDSRFGKIPKGWIYGKLDEVVSINDASVTQDYSYDNIKYIDISSVSQGELKNTTTYPLKDAPSRAKRLVFHGDTIWSCVRPNRKSHMFIYRPPKNLVVSTGFAVLSPREIGSCYLYSWVTTNEFVDYLTANADGSAYPAVRPQHFADSDILIPSESVLNSFQRIVLPIRNIIAENEMQSRTLASIRDSLLPKLMSGKIRVKEVMLDG